MPAQAAARSLGLQLHFLHASAEHDIDPVFATLVQLRAHGLVIGTDAFFNTRIGQLGALALQHAVPTVYQFRDFAAAGGLMSYGPSFSDGYRQVGIYSVSRNSAESLFGDPSVSLRQGHRHQAGHRSPKSILADAPQCLSGYRLTKPSRLGMRTFGKVWAFIPSLSPMILLSARMYAVTA